MYVFFVYVYTIVNFHIYSLIFVIYTNCRNIYYILYKVNKIYINYIYFIYKNIVGIDVIVCLFLNYCSKVVERYIDSILHQYC